MFGPETTEKKIITAANTSLVDVVHGPLPKESKNISTVHKTA